MYSVIIETHYLPSVAYFAALSRFDEIIVEKNEHYQKQTYRNRCYINNPQGKTMLIVPLASKHGKVNITEIRIDHSQKWLNNHWRTIRSAYGRAPFFEHYADDLHKVLFSKFDYLYDMNMAVLTLCLKWLKWNKNIKESLAYEATVCETITDFRSVIAPKKALAKNIYKLVAYYQVFGNKFVENLSLIDLIFCEGPGAAGIVHASVLK